MVVDARFDLQDLNAIDDEAETFAFTGVLTLTWHDPRQAFDPAVERTGEKVYQGAFQFNELSPSWYPQVVLLNETGAVDVDGVVQRVRPDGTATVVATIAASARCDLSMRRFPFDSQRLTAYFAVIGFTSDEVRFAIVPSLAEPRVPSAQLPQWQIRSFSLAIEDRPVPYLGKDAVASTLVMRLDVARKPFFVLRLVVIPLVVIVLLSFCVFWMDRASVGDRMSVSFIGILTGVAYQILMSDNLPRIAYFTLMHGFLNLSFVTMCATALVNLLVAHLERSGKGAAAHRLDLRCRWAFPLSYAALIGVMWTVAMTAF